MGKEGALAGQACAGIGTRRRHAFLHQLQTQLPGQRNELVALSYLFPFSRPIPLPFFHIHHHQQRPLFPRTNYYSSSWFGILGLIYFSISHHGSLRYS